MRRAGPEDRSRIEAGLRARIAISMFPLSNLLRHGMDTEHPRSMSMWLAEGDLPDVLSITRSGVVMPSCAAAPPPGLGRLLAGRGIAALNGPTAQVRPLIADLGLAGARADLDADDPQFLLDLDDLRVPEGPGALCPLRAADRATLIEWRRRYRVELMGTPPAAAMAQATRDIDGYIAEDSHRVLMDGSTPLAMTGFNAVLPGIVQVGGVFTPAPLRRRGHARRALALHLAEVRAHGVRQATLFAANVGAVAVYTALGFRRIGDWTIVMFPAPETAHG